MSKFLNLCEQIEKKLALEQDEQGQMPPEMASVQPGQPMQSGENVLDPETQSEVQEVSNEQIQKLIEVIVNFFQKGTPLSSDAKMSVDSLPAKINSENSSDTVNKLVDILTNSNFPSNTFDTSQ